MAGMYRTLPYQGGEPRAVAEVTNNAMNGKTNNTGNITLSASSTTTTLNDERLGFDSVVLLSPLTANAAAQSPYIASHAKGSAVIAHTSVGHADLLFAYIIVG